MKIGLSKVAICFQGWQSFHFIHVPVVKALCYEYGKARHCPTKTPVGSCVVWQDEIRLADRAWIHKSVESYDGNTCRLQHPVVDFVDKAGSFNLEALFGAGRCFP